MSEKEERKSLMNALKNLERGANDLVDLAKFSDSVVEKLNNPRANPEKSNKACEQGGDAVESMPDLIDLFNKVAEKIERATRRIGDNTGMIRAFIE